MNLIGRSLAVVLTGLAVAACGQASDDFGPPLSIVVHTPVNSSLESLGVTDMRVTVTGADLTAPVIETFPYGVGAGSLGAIPYGFERTVTVEAIGPAEGGGDHVVARGRSLPTDVPVGERAEVHVYVTPVERFSPAQAFASGGSPALLAAGRVGHSVTPLANGKVLIAGGAEVKINGQGELGIDRIYDTLEVYDPATGFIETLPIKLNPGRAFHTATRLRGTQGYVLISGGLTFISGSLVSLLVSDIFSPNEPGGGNLFKTMDLHTPRARHSATLRHDGSVLITGGVWINLGSADNFDDVGGAVSILDSSELFKVDAPLAQAQNCNHNSWAYCVQPPMDAPRVDHGSVRVGDAVLVVGGQNEQGILATTELYKFDEDSGAVTGTYLDGPRLHEPRVHAAVVRRSDDVVVVVGGAPVVVEGDEGGEGGEGGEGQDVATPLGSIEVYDPRVSSQQFNRSLAVLSVGRMRPAVAVLEDDRILIAGGEGPGGSYLDDAWLLEPSDGGVSSAKALSNTTLSDARADAIAVTTGTGHVLIAGGRNHPTPGTYTFPVGVDLFNP